MENNFDIIEYLSGLTGFVFDKAVLKRIALDRGVSEMVSYEELTVQQKELLLADLLYVVYVSPNSTASMTMQHGTYSKTIGAQTLNSKTGIYNIMYGIYNKYQDEKLEALAGISGGLRWVNENDY